MKAIIVKINAMLFTLDDEFISENEDNYYFEININEALNKIRELNNIRNIRYEKSSKEEDVYISHFATEKISKINQSFFSIFNIDDINAWIKEYQIEIKQLDNSRQITGEQNGK